MREDITANVRGCTACQKIKSRNHGPYGMTDSKVPHQPGFSVSCDILGPLPTAQGQYEYILVLTDDFTKNFELYPLRVATAKAAAKCLVENCCRHGFMKNLRSDNGRQFASMIWNETCKMLGIKARKTSPYRPAGNPTKRLNRTIKQCLKAYCSSHRDWAKYLPTIAFALRTAVNETTGQTPAMLTYGRELDSPFAPATNTAEGNTSNYCEYTTKLQAKMKEIFEQTRAAISRNRKTYEKGYNKRRIASPFKVGDLVLRQTNRLSRANYAVTSSLIPQFEGPHKLARQFGRNVFSLENLDGKDAGSRNVDQLKLFVAPPQGPAQALPAAKGTH
ncbi:hypothetical protein B566_EDAN009997 [Ephemera danica]|nr:hypothetical protein B566_EDAN009997 [Ephemera danica]